ncbi:hypothetical protein BJV82DRAFT_584686 [Fennellomyces sp. T-0311]|nr:hypothetical protein BJV82DRAFT_584686 [Fennellomyces sp. T-0311]
MVMAFHLLQLNVTVTSQGIATYYAKKGEIKLISNVVSSREDPYLTWLSKFPVVEWSPVFTEYTTSSTSDDDTLFSSEGENLHPIQGIAQYQMKGNKVLFSFNGGVFLGDVGRISSLIPYYEQRKQQTPHDPPVFILQSAGQSDSPPSPHLIDPPSPKQTANRHLTRSDPKLGGSDDNLIAFIRDRDIWVVTHDGYEVQLTACSFQTKDPTLSCGTVEYVMQEEFQRYTGYYWGPSLPDSPINRILYLETSEEQVEMVVITKPTSGLASQNDHRTTSSPVRYPRAGRSNAVSDIQIVEFDTIVQGHPTLVVRKRLWGGSVNERFPWTEYIVRFGWLPDGQSVWVQVLSRDQKRMAVLRIKCDQFVSEAEYRQDRRPTSFEILWEESSDNWINISDAYFFLNSSKTDCTEFIWSSEMSGFRHLYFVRKQGSDSTVVQLTKGDWVVTDHAIDVDERRQLVYFKAKKDTPVETHFYVTSYRQPTDNPNPIVRLTQLGFSHVVTMDTAVDAFVDCFTNLHHTPCIAIRRLEYHEGADYALPTVSESQVSLLIPIPTCTNDPEPCNDGPASYEEVRRMSQPQIVYVAPTLPAKASDNHSMQYSSSNGIEYLSAMKSTAVESFDPETQSVPAGEIFNFSTDDGARLYGYLYKPRFYQPGISYPTILYIYGGPKTQMVTNDFRLPRLQRYLMSAFFGFAVVVIDGRGSSDRGIQFESHLKRRLGSVEIDDQIAGLQHVCNARIGAEPTLDGRLVSVVDLNRVSINGWSYGGYLSLMGLAQRPDIFKIAIAGAPVTQWELYDSAYTERYMGIPADNPAGYQSGSVVNWADRFPDSEHRLLIAHGLIDENVHFTNTEHLVSKLVKHNKPHYLQVYPTEKHGLRHASVNEHFETLMFFWLINYL